MKTGMEKQKCMQRETVASITGRHLEELKDLGKKRTESVSTQFMESVTLFLKGIIGLSYIEKTNIQRLNKEHERYQDLQCRYQRMQEDYVKQLKAAEESRVTALEEQKQLYDAKLQEKIHLLAQVSHEEQMEYEAEGTERHFLLSTLILCSVRRMCSSKSMSLRRWWGKRKKIRRGWSITQKSNMRGNCSLSKGPTWIWKEKLVLWLKRWANHLCDWCAKHIQEHTCYSSYLSFLLFFSSLYLFSFLLYVFWPLTNSAYFVPLKPFNYQDVQLFQDICALTFLFSALHTFYNIHTFSYFFKIM